MPAKKQAEKKPPSEKERLAKLEQVLAVNLNVDLSEKDEHAVVEAVAKAKEKKPLSVDERLARLELILRGHGHHLP